MKAFSLTIKAMHIVRIDPGEDVLEAVQQFIDDSGVKQAVVVAGYGTLVAHSLHWVTHTRIPTDNRFETGEGAIEVLSMNGLVTDGEPHIHVTLSTPEGAYGGHLEPGCRAYVLCEVYLAEIEGTDLHRVRVPVAIPDMGEGTIPRLVDESGD